MNPLMLGAKTAITTCLAVTPADRVFIVTDLETNKIGAALLAEALKVGAVCKLVNIEDFTQRPATTLPHQLATAIREFKPTVSIYAAQALQGELPVFRRPLCNVFVDEFACRHAHMVGITDQLMLDGMTQDYNVVQAVTKKVYALVAKARSIVVTDPFGTNITYTLDPSNIKWVLDTGFIATGEFRNLPGGEVFTAPVTVSGVFAGWVLGDTLVTKYKELPAPLKVEVKNSIIQAVYCDASAPKQVIEAVSDFKAYVAEFKDGNRVGELGIGTLIGLKGFVGNLLQDEKFPGVHMAFGNPYPHETGADWSCPSHIDLIAKQTTILVDGSPIMTDGKFIAEVV